MQSAEPDRQGLYGGRAEDNRGPLPEAELRIIIEPDAAVQALEAIPGRQLVEVRREIDDLVGATAYHTDAHWLSDCCGNDVMAGALRGLRATTRLFEIGNLKDRLTPDSTEHLIIIDALQNKDADAVRRSASSHVESLIGFARRHLRTSD
jgi:DNA-binding GntR family transcriptional regulator